MLALVSSNSYLNLSYHNLLVFQNHRIPRNLLITFKSTTVSQGLNYANIFSVPMTFG